MDSVSANGLSIGCKTDIGKKRAQNQDNLSSHPHLGLFVVADGMGGHQGGETASRIASEVIPKTFQELKEKNWDNRSALTRAIQEASRSINEQAASNPKLDGMGTTTVTLLMDGEQAFIGHVGDSRCYLIRDEKRHHKIGWL